MLVILYRRTEPGNAFYYTLDDRQQNLFKPFSLTVSWGRHPEGGRKVTHYFESLDEKNRMIRRLLSRKLRTYKVLYSYFKEMQGKILDEAKARRDGDGAGPNRDWAAR